MPKAPPRLDPANPVHGFALEMRKLRLRAGDPSLAELARAMTCSHSTVSAYINGRRLPLPRQLASFVLACKGDPSDWLERLGEVRGRLGCLSVAEVLEDDFEPHSNEVGERARTAADNSIGTAGPEVEKTTSAATSRSPKTQTGTLPGGNPDDGPTYRRIANDLRRAIESGELKPGVLLPTEPDLAGQYETKRNTIRDAIKLLTSQGLAETRPGQGTFVTRNRFVTMMSSSGSTEGLGSHVAVDHGTPQHSEPRVEIRTALGRLAAQLHVAERSELISRQQQRWIDGDPWSLQTSLYPMELIRKGADRLLETKPITGGTGDYLDHELGIKPARSRDEIRVRTPDPDEITFFRLPDDSRKSVIEVSRITYDEQGSPVLLTITVYPADRNWLAYEI